MSGTGDRSFCVSLVVLLPPVSGRGSEKSVVQGSDGGAGTLCDHPDTVLGHLWRHAAGLSEECRDHIFPGVVYLMGEPGALCPAVHHGQGTVCTGCVYHDDAGADGYRHCLYQHSQQNIQTYFSAQKAAADSRRTFRGESLQQISEQKRQIHHYQNPQCEHGL